MTGKKLILTLFSQNHIRNDWQLDLGSPDFNTFYLELANEMAKYDIELVMMKNDSVTIDINSYADLLNSVRISSPEDGFANKCVGHIIGKSDNLDLKEDIARAVKRIAFAPETVPPDDHNRRVCHNCGCGC